MKLADVLALIPDATKHDAIAAEWKRIADDAFDAGKAESGVEGRKAAKALRDAEAERDRLSKELDDLRAGSAEATKAADELKEARKALKAIEDERDKMRPVYERHERETLRSAVAAAARLKDPVVAGTLVTDLGIALGPDGKLSPEHAKALAEWAANPANAERVKPVESKDEKPAAPAAPAQPAQPASQMTSPQYRITAPPTGGAGAGTQAAADLAKLRNSHPLAAQAAEARLKAEGLL